ncbi:MAG: hypothetical protein J6Y35_00800 [Bacteroidales bacterium]|nr:hypothetical protein [Bacteroidales bacterium]
MKKAITLLLITLLCANNLHAQHSPSDIKQILTTNFENLYKQYDNEEAFDSILLKVNGYIGDVEKRYQSSPTAADLCEAAVWHSYKGSLLSKILEQQRWTISSRTQTESANGSDWKTWDITTFERKILEEFYASLQDKDVLMATSSKDYFQLFGMPDEKGCYPNLYDLLAYRFADHLSNFSSTSPRPAEEFDLNQTTFFDTQLPDFETKDSLSIPYHFLKTIQEIERKHQNDIEADFRLYNRLIRLNYVRQNSQLENRDELYLAALLILEEDCEPASDIIKQLIYYSLGSFYHSRGNNSQEYPDDFITAISWYEKAIAAVSENACAKTCKENIRKIKEPKRVLRLADDVMYPTENLMCAYSKECDKLYWAVVRYTDTFDKYQKANEKITLSIVRQDVIDIHNTKLYRTDTTMAVLPVLETGHYLLLAASHKIASTITGAQLWEYEMSAFYISRLRVSYTDDSTHIHVQVFDRKTGEPLPDVEVCLTAEYYNATPYRANQLTDNNGWVKFSKSEINKVLKNKYYSCSITLKKGNDILSLNINNLERYTYKDSPRATCAIYTDRAIYRPGQTIEWKAILFNQSKYDEQLIPNTKVIVQLKENNGTLIHRDTLTTNEFGSVSGSFKVPETGFLGQYGIFLLYNGKHTNNKWVDVEEYKRPTFEVVMDKPDGTYRLGSEVRMNGTATAYAGYAVQGAKVSYRIVRNASFPFRYYGWWFRPTPTVPAKEIAHGECTTNEDGHFTIRFTADGDPDIERNLPLYRYTVTATVTDPSGETHEVSAVVPVSQRTILFDVEVPECLRAYRNENRIAVRTNNLAGEPQAAEVRYSVVRIAQPETYKIAAPFHVSGAAEAFGSRFPQYDFKGQTEPYQWKETQTMESGQFTTSASSEVVLQKLSSYPTGAYKLKLTTTDAFRQTVEEEYIFYVSQKEDNLPFYTALSVTCDKMTAAVGETITFVIGSRLKKQPVYIRIFNNDKLLEEKWTHLDNSTYLFRHTVKSGEEGKFCCYAYTAWENEIYSEEATIQVPEVQRKIRFDFVTFRDKLQPGGQETVRIRMTDGSGKPISAAELLCTLYDASLDAFVPHSFVQTLFSDRKPESKGLYRSGPYGREYNQYLSFQPYFSSYDIDLPRWMVGLRHLISNRYRNHVAKALASSEGISSSNGMLTTVRGARSDADEIILNVVEEADFEFAQEESVELGKWDGEPTLAKGEEQAEIPLRSNFNETAFFYPFLTVKDGVAEFEYTVPESLTKWKMFGAAHTTQRQYGTFEKFVVTQKTLMTSPNLPRFIYEGDTWDFAAKAVNMGDVALNGTAELRLLNAEDGAVLFSQVQDVAIAAGGSSPVKFTVAIPEGLAGIRYILTVRASGGANTYSDGETGELPVLTRRQIVTETLPLFITKQGSRSFSLKDLPASSNSVISCKLQFTPDPRWNAVLALPYLMEYPYDCNEQIFSKLYANTVAVHIISQNPNFSKLFQQAQKDQPDALRSQLVQNADLKQILLAETPWVADAMDEDNEIQNIACLFDKQNITEQRKAMVQKLERNQNADGGWNWFASRPNERSSRYITQHLLIGSGRLMDKGICKAGDNFLKENTLKKAVAFIDDDVQRDYQEMKKKYPEQLKEERIDANTLHYLYARSFFLKMKSANTEAYKFYKGKLVDYANELDNIYLKTMAALTLWQSNATGDRELAQKLMLEVKRWAIHSEEFGMYWKKEGYGWYWYEAPIERQALLIEAFQTILQDEESVKEMKIWLLQQKRTQHWASTRSTADACYALLLDKGSERDNADSHITVRLCGETIDFADTLQLPVKRDVESCLQHSGDGTVTLTRDNDGLSYGGVFVRYYKDIDEIAGTGTEMPLSVERQLFKVSYGERGEVLTELRADGGLQVGDRVRVRMVLRADRNLEFVHLKDLRAAAFEPTETLSGYRSQDGLWYYQSFRDASVNFFFDWLRKGTYVFEYTLFVTQSGTYSSGYASIQCMYAPEFSAHSAGSGKLVIKESKK